MSLKTMSRASGVIGSSCLSETVGDTGRGFNGTDSVMAKPAARSSGWRPGPRATKSDAGTPRTIGLRAPVAEFL
eukprot:4820057-Pyramimonas_sp.AAC.1